MAGSFVVVSQTPDVQVLGPTSVLDVERVGFITRPTGIYVEVPVPRVSWLQLSQGDNLGAYADAIEGLVAQGLAVGGSYASDLDENGLLVDYIDFIVQYTPPDSVRPPMTATVRVTLGSLGASGDPFFAGLADSPASLLAAAYAKLEETANLQMVWALSPRPLNPPIRVDDEVTFWDGAARKLTEDEIARLERGEEVIVSKPPWRDWREHRR